MQLVDGERKTRFQKQRVDGAAGIKGIEPILTEINEAERLADIQHLFGELAPMGVGTPIGLYIGTDSKNSKENTVYASQSGLNLPDRDYYLSDKEKFADIREAYIQHINKMMELTGQPSNVGQSILNLETKIAQISWTRQQRRNPDSTYNKKDFDQWDNSLDVLDVRTIVNTRGFGDFDTIIVGQPSFFIDFNELLESTPVEDWKNYLRWSTVTSFANSLTSALEDENFDFYRRTLRGVSTMKPRNERVFSKMDRVLSEPLGKLFVKEHFSEESKEYMRVMIE